MLNDEKIEAIVNGFLTSNQMAITGYKMSKNEANFIFKDSILNELYSLFDFKNDNVYRIEFKNAFITIFNWYNFYRNCYYKTPTIQAIRDELKEIEEHIDRLLNKLHESNTITKHILKNYTPKHASIIDHKWFRNVVKIEKPGTREWSGTYTLCMRRFIKLRAFELLHRCFNNAPEEGWHRSRLRFVFFSKRKKREEIGNYLINKNLIEHIASISSVANNRAKQLEVDRKRITQRDQPGEHSIFEILWPSPEIFLLRECGLLLAANGFIINNDWKLAGLIHAQCLISSQTLEELPFSLNIHSINKFIRRWAVDNRPEVRRWLDQIRPYIGKFRSEDASQQNKPCVFPSPNHFPTLSVPTLWHCLLPDGEGSRVHPPKNLWIGPGWEKAGVVENRYNNLPQHYF